MASDSLNVIALISGGKDSFFSLLHCIQNGHRVVALANLYPATDGVDSSDVQVINPAQLHDAENRDTAQGKHRDGDSGEGQGASSKSDLNSFMYQTVGHEVISLYAAATGLPLYRHAIRGSAVRHERDYDPGTADKSTEGDETESMIPLLRTVMAHHPDANALCSGAILSTYQRTRVESVALRLGLVPLAYLWKYTILPPPSLPADPAQLLRDMATTGLEARIIKVASAGLDEDHLWGLVSSDRGAERVKGALRKFGAADGAALGEGGEFETLVVNGPSVLFKKRVNVSAGNRVVVNEGGGSCWLMLKEAHLLDKPTTTDEGADLVVRKPDLLDAKFKAILDELETPQLRKGSPTKESQGLSASSLLGKSTSIAGGWPGCLHWTASSRQKAGNSSIEEETATALDDIRHRLSANERQPEHITSVIIILRNMGDFPKVNAEYGKLFTAPNPPSRITISCGDLLPAGMDILIHVTVPGWKPQEKHIERDGLHVQSRSYWAPANIGPYSQAITTPLSASDGLSHLKSVYIAGQIPLIPASMSLPAPSETSPRLQIALSLQHLWRIGVDRKVQFWTSAIAYFSKTLSAQHMQQSARLAGRAWAIAHAAPEEEENDDDGPDLWDLKYNAQHMALSGGGEQKPSTSLPDWSVLTLRQQNEPAGCVPPMFAAELEELPRQSAVEWHAHIGLSNVGEGDVELVHVPDLGLGGWRASHLVVRGSEGAYFVHTVLSYAMSEGDAGVFAFDDMWHGVTKARRASVAALGYEDDQTAVGFPYLAYIDGSAAEMREQLSTRVGSDHLPYAHVPCRSLWSAEGERLGCVALYKPWVKK